MEDSQNACIPYVGVDVMFDFDQILKSLLSGKHAYLLTGIPGMYCDRLQDVSGKKCRRAG